MTWRAVLTREEEARFYFYRTSPFSYLNDAIVCS
jgi:hypothetical protein